MTAQKKLEPKIIAPISADDKRVKADNNRDKADNNRDKADIDRMKRLLSEKIKDPKLAKKAAMIIAEMLNKKD